MRSIFGAALGAALLLSVPAVAEEQTVTLAVEGMWCAGCEYIVKETLAQVPGVRGVKVSGRARSAVVTFDDRETTLAALIEATAEVGFPSTPKE